MQDADKEYRVTFTVKRTQTFVGYATRQEVEAMLPLTPAQLSANDFSRCDGEEFELVSTDMVDYQAEYEDDADA